MALPRSETPSFPGYTIDRVHRNGAVHKGRVLFGRRGERLCVVKDLSSMRPLLRVLFGRRNLAREARALEMLSDFPAAPRLIERISRDAIAVERIEGKYKYLHKKIPRRVLPAVFAALERAVDELHRRGLVHLDLRQRKNILVPTDDSVVLIDFESSLRLGRGVLGRRVLLPLLGWLDRAAILKWKAKFSPRLLTDGERRFLRRFRLWRAAWPWKRLGRKTRRWFGSDTTR